MASISWPFDQSRISEGYGYAEWRGGIHDGIDFAIPAGTELRAAASGTVYNNDAGSDGAGVDITTDDGWKVRMWHVSKFMVANGSYVNAGDVIALSGGVPGTWGAGRTTGPHMHFGVKVAGSWIDPAAVINGGAVSAPAATGSVTELAQAVMRGDFGNGPARRAALGDRFDEVQAEVNRLLGGGAPAPAPAPVAVENNVVQPGDGYWHIAQRVWGGDNAQIEANMHKLIELNGNKRLYAGDTVILDAPAPAPAPEPTPTPAPEPTPEPAKEEVKPVEPERKKPIIKPAIKPTPPKKKEPIMTKKEEQAALAALPHVDLGVIIPTVKARKIAYIVFAAVAFLVTNIGVGFAAAGLGWPVWLVVTVAVTNNMAPLFATLAVANASNAPKE